MLHPLDRNHLWLKENSVPVLYGGPMEMGDVENPNDARFFEDPDRLKPEYVYRP